MPYNNPELFDAAFSGASGGSFGRWITAENQSDYDVPVDAVEAFATAVDAAIPVIASVSISDAILLQAIIQGVITTRSLASLTLSDYADIASAIAALFEEARTRLNSQIFDINTDQVSNVSDVLAGTGTASDALDYLYRKQRIIIEPDATHIVEADDAGALILCTNAAGCVVTADNNVLALENVVMFRQVGAGAVSFAGTLTITPPVTNLNTTAQQGATIAVIWTSATTAISLGDLSDA